MAIREIDDVSRLAEPQSYDLITAFDVIHDLAHPEAMLGGIHAVLRPDGCCPMAEIAASSHLEGTLDEPLAPSLSTISTMHCMTVSLAQGGDGPGTFWGEESARAMLKEVGFTQVESREVPGDLLDLYYLMRP